jgi:hypothetical protein
LSRHAQSDRRLDGRRLHAMTYEEEFVSDHRVILEAKKAFDDGRWPDALEQLNNFLKHKHMCNEAAQHEWAMSFIRRRCRWFRDRLGEEALAKWKAGEFKNAGEFGEYLRDRASELVSHVADAQLYLVVSDSSDQVAIEGIEFTNSRGVDWCVAATYALEQDARDDLANDNVTGEPPEAPSTWCDQCSKWRPNIEWVEGDDICSQCAHESM